MAETKSVSTQPVSYDLVGGGVLAVRWQDGHESLYDPALLRAHCPCALCKVRRTSGSDPAGSGPLKLLRPGEGVADLLGLEPVGRYALRLRWSDRHDTGIYEFRRLRPLCPCGECR